MTMSLGLTVGQIQMLKKWIFRLLPAGTWQIGGFKFTYNGENIVLKVGHLFKIVDEFRIVVKVFAI